MKITSLTALLFFVLDVPAFAQETVAPAPEKLHQLYFSYGSGNAFTNSGNTNSLGQNIKVHLTATTRNNYLFRFGGAYSGFEDNQPASRKWKEDHPNRNDLPRHFVFSPFLAFGKRKPFSARTQAQVLAGLSFNNYRGPENVYRLTEGSGILGPQERLDYKMRTRQSAGLLVQAEVMGMPLRFAGLTLGGYYHYIPRISNGGFNLSLNIGRVRPKEIL